MLMLLLPHRQENELLEPFNTAQEAFVNKAHLFNQSVDHTYFDFASDIDIAIRRIRLISQELQDSYSSNNSQQNTYPDHIDSEILETNSTKLPQPPEIQQDSLGHMSEDIHVSHILPACHHSPRELQQTVLSFTSCQLNAFKNIQAHYTNSNNKLHLFISGPGGAGKTFLINSVISYLQLYHPILQGVSPVLVCAPTGTAARNVKGSTIHSLLKIPVQQYMNYEPISNPVILKALRDAFAGVHTLIIDEISMVSATMLSLINNRLTEIFDTNEPFGNLNIIVFGDLFQLRPVRGKHIFHNHILWRTFSFLKLTSNVRQCADKEYAQLLNRARIGALQPCDIELLASRLIDPERNDIPDALHIYPTRKEVDEYKKHRQSMLNENVTVVEAFHYFCDQNELAGGEVPNHLIPQDDRDAGNLPRYLDLSVGTRVMLIRNIFTKNGLVNGVMGAVKEINKNIHNTVSSITVLFDNPEVGRISSVHTRGHQPISITRISHNYIVHGTTVRREQFPLVPCWACTIHNVQGATLSQVVVNLGSSVFEAGMAYVALSRVSTLQGLHLAALNVKKITASAEVLDEYARLRSSSDKDKQTETSVHPSVNNS